MASATYDRQRAPARVTPLVELMLVLLVIAWAAMASGALRTPGADASQQVQELRLQIGPAGTYALDGRPVAPADLDVALHQAHARSPDLRLRIAAAEGGDYRAFVHALASAQDAGIRNVGSEML